MFFLNLSHLNFWFFFLRIFDIFIEASAQEWWLLLYVLWRLGGQLHRRQLVRCGYGTRPSGRRGPWRWRCGSGCLVQWGGRSFFRMSGKTKNQTNEKKYTTGKYTNSAEITLAATPTLDSLDVVLFGQNLLPFATVVSSVRLAKPRNLCPRIVSEWSRDRDVGPTDVLCYQSAHWEVIQCQKMESKI